MSNPIVYFDIDIGGKSVGRIEMTLRADVVPKTAENFLQLCSKSPITLNNKTYTLPAFYKTIFTTVTPTIGCIGGNFDLVGGSSIYGKRFPDENFKLKHDSVGILSMENDGTKNTNGSKFVITFAATSFRDNKNVVFGKVTKGLDVLKLIEAVGSGGGKPSMPVTITKCGQL